jgi:hypothetical protein
MNAQPTNPKPQTFVADIDGVRWTLTITEHPEKIRMAIASHPPGALPTAKVHRWLASAQEPYEADPRPGEVAFTDTGRTYLKPGHQPVPQS